MRLFIISDHCRTDYAPVPLRLISIEPDDNRTCFSGVIINDVIGGEGVEFFTLNIPEPTQPGVNVGLNQTTININDDDSEPLPITLDNMNFFHTLTHTCILSLSIFLLPPHIPFFSFLSND